MSKTRSEYPARTWSAEEFNPGANPFVIPLVKPGEAHYAAYVASLIRARDAWKDRYEREFIVSDGLALENAQSLAEIEKLKADRSEQAQEIIRQLQEKKDIADRAAVLSKRVVELETDLKCAHEGAKQMSDTISDLQEKLEITRAMNAALTQRIATYESAVDPDSILQHTKDARLGALVRQMPQNFILRRAKDPGSGWCLEGMNSLRVGDTPEEVLQNLKDGE